jgi:phage terminase small subunit
MGLDVVVTMATTDRDGLTIKQERFAQRYVELGNASEAYRQSYDASAMKPETINRSAKELLDNHKVAARIEGLQDLALKRHQVTIDRVIAEYARLAFLDVRKAFNDQGDLLPIHEIDDDTAAAISGIECEAIIEGRDRTPVGTLKKIKLADKKGALDSIAKYLGMFIDKTEITGKDGVPLVPRRIEIEFLPPADRPDETPTA